MTTEMNEIERDVLVLEGSSMLPLSAVFAGRVIDHCRALADRLLFLEAVRRAGERGRAEG